MNVLDMHTTQVALVGGGGQSCSASASVEQHMTATAVPVGRDEFAKLQVTVSALQVLPAYAIISSLLQSPWPLTEVHRALWALP